MENRLTKDLASVIHHVELHQSGWWEKTIQRFIMIVLYFEGPTDKGQLCKLVNNNFKLGLDSNTIDRQVEKMTQSSLLFVIDDNKIKLSQDEYKKITIEYEAFDKIEHAAKTFFKEILAEKSEFNNVNLDEEWEKFDSEVLIPLINSLGARTYEMISGSVIAKQESLKFLDNKVYEREVILKFLDSSNPSVREYVLRKLNAYFCYESSKLSKETIEKISTISKQNIVFNVFVDTNFLFSILGLHDNPSNEAANSLIGLTNTISNKINVRYYITDLTIREAKGVLLAQKTEYEGLRYFPNVSEALQHTSASGFIKKYYEGERKKVSFKEYCEHYINNFITYAEAKKVNLYNDKTLSEYTKKQKVIDDILEQQEQEDKKVALKSGRKGKSYEQLLHDIALWHFVKDKRNPVVESTLEARNWIVTIDNQFISFDKKKMFSEHSIIPICINPTNLIQLLQFWVPRSEAFEKAMFQNLKLPFLFHEFDTESEKITAKILKVLSVYEQHVNSLPSESMGRIIVNDSLRKQVESATSEKEREDLIENALIKEVGLIDKELKKKEEEIKATKKTIAEQDLTIKKKDGEINREKSEKSDLLNKAEKLKNEKSELEGNFDRAAKEAYDLYCENREIANETKANEQFQRDYKKAKRRSIVNLIVMVVATALVFSLAYFFKIEIKTIYQVLASAVIGLLITTLNKEHFYLWLFDAEQKDKKRSIRESVEEKNPKKSYESYIEQFVKNK